MCEENTGVIESCRQKDCVLCSILLTAPCFICTPSPAPTCRKIVLVCVRSAVQQADGPGSEHASIGKANDNTHVLYKVIIAAISLFNNSEKQETTPAQLHHWLDCTVRRKWRQAYDRVPNGEIFILANDRDAIISKAGRLVP